MQRTRAIPVAWLGSGSCPNWPYSWILIIYIYIYISTHTCLIGTYIHAYEHYISYMHIWIHIYVSAYKYGDTCNTYPTYIHTYTQACISYMHTWIHIYVRAYKYGYTWNTYPTYIHTYTQACINTHTHTHWWRAEFFVPSLCKKIYSRGPLPTSWQTAIQFVVLYFLYNFETSDCNNANHYSVQTFVSLLSIRGHKGNKTTRMCMATLIIISFVSCQRWHSYQIKESVWRASGLQAHRDFPRRRLKPQWMSNHVLCLNGSKPSNGTYKGKGKGLSHNRPSRWPKGSG